MYLTSLFPSWRSSVIAIALTSLPFLVSAASPALSPADEAISQARQALSRNSAEGLERATQAFNAQAGAATAHPLALYLPYWRLRIKLQDAQQDQSQFDPQVREYLAKYPGTIAGDLLRRDWLLSLGKRRDWANFEEQFSLWLLRDDNQAFCYDIERRAQKADANANAEQLAAQARVILQHARDFSEGCASMTETLIKQKLLPAREGAARVYAALEANHLGHARRLAALVPGLDDASAFELAVNKPQAAIAQARSREIVLVALSRLARSNPEDAASALAASTTLAVPERSLAWAWVAAHGARKHAPLAAQWAKLSLTPSQPAVSLLSAETHQWLVRAALRELDWPLVAKLIDRMPENLRTLSGEQRDDTWVYWRGRAHAAANEKELAQALYLSIAKQFTFYGQLASEELGALQTLPPKAALVTPEEINAWDNNLGLVRARRFYDLGLRFEGNREWNWQLRGLSDRQLLGLGEWARNQQMLDRTINSSDRTTREFDFSQRFPTPFSQLVLSAAKERQLDAASIYGLVRQESRFIMDARSSVGAQGLMQIMPATGRWIANKLGVKGFTTSMLGDPATNVSFGTFYLKTVLDEFDGSLALAAAAYNAGPSRSRTWRASLKQPVEAAIFAESIPFTETRDYVKKVLSNATIYGQALNPAGPHTHLKTRLGQVVPKASTVTSDTP
jgi:soluble lytic murein transglycosylase